MSSLLRVFCIHCGNFICTDKEMLILKKIPNQLIILLENQDTIDCSSSDINMKCLSCNFNLGSYSGSYGNLDCNSIQGTFNNLNITGNISNWLQTPIKSKEVQDQCHLQCNTCQIHILSASDMCLYFQSLHSVRLIASPKELEKLDGQHFFVKADLKKSLKYVCCMNGHWIGKMTQLDDETDVQYAEFERSSTSLYMFGKRQTGRWADLESILPLNKIYITSMCGSSIENITPPIIPSHDELCNLISHYNLTTTRPYDYQIEMLYYAVQFNSIIHLITGAGKTLVSAMAIRLFHNYNDTKFCVVVEPTVALVSQQANYYRNELNLIVQECVGETKQSEKTEIWKSGKQKYDILVTTPKMFYDYIGQHRISMGQISLIVIDEAHSIRGNSPIRKLLKSHYLALNAGYRPRILGLTASPNQSPDAITQSAVFNDLQQIVNGRLVTPIHTNMYRLIDNASTIIKEIAPDSHEEFFYSRVSLFFETSAAFINQNSDNHATVLKNIAWNSYYKSLIPGCSNSSFLAAIQLLYEASNCFDVLYVNGPNHTASILNTHFEKCVNTKSLPIGFLDILNPFRLYLRDLIKSDSKSSSVNVNCSSRTTALLQLLADVLESCSSAQISKLRILIFVSKRVYTRLLLMLFKQSRKFNALNPTFIVGQNNSSGMQLKKDHVPIMDAFKRGLSKLLISTSALEEGIDVPNCSHVILYNDEQLNTLRMIQMRGRVRSSAGSFIILCAAKNSKNFKDLRRSEALSRHAILDICKKWRTQRIDVKVESFISKYVHSKITVPLNTPVIPVYSIVRIHISPDISSDLIELLSNQCSANSLLYENFTISGNLSLYGLFLEVQAVVSSVLPNKLFSIRLIDNNIDKSSCFANTTTALSFTISALSRGYSVNPCRFYIQESLTFDFKSLIFDFSKSKCTFPYKCYIAEIPITSIYPLLLVNMKSSKLLFNCTHSPYFYNTNNERVAVDLKLLALYFEFELLLEDEFYSVFVPFIKQYTCLNIQFIEYASVAATSTVNNRNDNPLGYAYRCLYSTLLDPNISSITIPIEKLEYAFSNPPSPFKDNSHDIKGYASSKPEESLGVSESTSLIIDTANAKYKRCHRVLFTPSRMIIEPYILVHNNRVLNTNPNYYVDDFMLVQFIDEERQRCYINNSNLIINGFYLYSFKWSFLGATGSQIRSHSAWFTRHSPDDILPQFGSFDLITNNGLQLSRIGLLFSSTVKIVNVPLDALYAMSTDFYTSDYKYNYSDGVGTMSLAFAQYIQSRLQLLNTPSAVQFRAGPFKGVLSLVKGQQCPIICRPSMRKYLGHHRAFELVEYSRPIPCYLNRQIIMILNSLGIRDEVFMSYMTTDINNIHTNNCLNTMNNDIPFYSKHCMQLLNTVDVSRHAFWQNVINLSRNQTLNGLIHKARIKVPKGRLLMGIIDEYGVLLENQVYIAITKDDSSIQYITGKCVVIKNPCVHPGDCRPCKAIGKRSEFDGLVDVIIMPRKGYRDLASQTSGGDLDGDQFTCIWDENLIPQKFVAPMELDASAATEDATTSIQHAYIKIMNEDCIGLLSHAHLALSDQLPGHVTNPKCIKLAHLISKSVDFPKKLQPIHIPDELLRNLQYPDYLEKRGCIKYNSCHVLGSLYRKAKTFIDDDVVYNTSSTSFTSYRYSRIDTIYNKYKDSINSIGRAYNITNEYELITGYTVSSNRHKHQLSSLISTLTNKTRYLLLCAIKAACSESKDSAELKFILKYLSQYQLQSFQWCVYDLIFQYNPLLRASPISADADVPVLHDNVMKYYNDRVPDLLQQYDSRYALCNHINVLCKSINMGYTAFIYGSTSYMLFDLQSDVDFCVYNTAASTDADNKIESESVQRSTTYSLLASIHHQIKLDYPSALLINANVPIIKHAANPTFDISMNSRGIYKTLLILNVLNQYPGVYPWLLALTEYGKTFGLTIKNRINEQSQIMSTFGLIWIYLLHFKEYYEVKPLNIDSIDDLMIKEYIKGSSAEMPRLIERIDMTNSSTSTAAVDSSAVFMAFLDKHCNISKMEVKDPINHGRYIIKLDQDGVFYFKQSMVEFIDLLTASNYDITKVFTRKESKHIIRVPFRIKSVFKHSFEDIKELVLKRASRISGGKPILAQLELQEMLHSMYVVVKGKDVDLIQHCINLFMKEQMDTKCKQNVEYASNAFTLIIQGIKNDLEQVSIQMVDINRLNKMYIISAYDGDYNKLKFKYSVTGQLDFNYSGYRAAIRFGTFNLKNICSKSLQLQELEDLLNKYGKSVRKINMQQEKLQKEQKDVKLNENLFEKCTAKEAVLQQRAKYYSSTESSLSKLLPGRVFKTGFTSSINRIKLLIDKMGLEYRASKSQIVVKSLINNNGYSIIINKETLMVELVIQSKMRVFDGIIVNEKQLVNVPDLRYNLEKKEICTELPDNICRILNVNTSIQAIGKVKFVSSDASGVLTYNLELLGSMKVSMIREIEYREFKSNSHKYYINNVTSKSLVDGQIQGTRNGIEMEIYCKMPQNNTATELSRFSERYYEAGIQVINSMRELVDLE
eukprot:NODE_167_length_16327_cov_0.361597.p1 type:complete len:2533 gc:universal NODE_167_length_16327_cov_0.361597:11222-3624(-)